jgi:hypothetical protein
MLGEPFRTIRADTWGLVVFCQEAERWDLIVAGIEELLKVFGRLDGMWGYEDIIEV